MAHVIRQVNVCGETHTYEVPSNESRDVKIKVMEEKIINLQKMVKELEYTINCISNHIWPSRMD